MYKYETLHQCTWLLARVMGVVMVSSVIEKAAAFTGCATDDCRLPRLLSCQLGMLGALCLWCSSCLPPKL